MSSVCFLFLSDFFFCLPECYNLSPSPGPCRGQRSAVQGPRSEVRPDHHPSSVLVFQQTCRDVPAVSSRPELVLITSVSIEWAQACKPLTVIHLLLSRHQDCTTGRRPTLSDQLQLPDLLFSPHGSVTPRDAERRPGGSVGGGAERWSLQDRVRSRYHHRETGHLCERTGESWESRWVTAERLDRGFLVLNRRTPITYILTLLTRSWCRSWFAVNKIGS